MVQYTRQLTTENPLVLAALRYAALGWPVFPVFEAITRDCACGNSECGSPGKHPRTERGFKDATRDPGVIRDWWGRWPAANIGVATGPGSGLLMIGPDGDEGKADLAELERENGTHHVHRVLHLVTGVT